VGWDGSCGVAAGEWPKSGRQGSRFNTDQIVPQARSAARKTRSPSREFKIEAVRLVRERGVSLAQATGRLPFRAC
jgi:hypothetical protein